MSAILEDYVVEVMCSIEYLGWLQLSKPSLLKYVRLNAKFFSFQTTFCIVKLHFQSRIPTTVSWRAFSLQLHVLQPPHPEQELNFFVMVQEWQR